MTEDIQKIVDDIVNDFEGGSPAIVVHPDAIEKLKRSGLRVVKIPRPTIEQLFEERKKSALQKSEEIPPLPTGLPHAFEAIYQEIRECIFFEVNGAAITLSSILVEFALKQATFIMEAGGYGKTNPSTWDEFENMDLSASINRAKRAGLVNSKMAKALQDFKKAFRNPYSHYNIKKITQHVVAHDVKLIDADTGETQTTDLAAINNPSIQALAKPLVDEHEVMNVFIFADVIVRQLFSQITPKEQ